MPITKEALFGDDIFLLHDFYSPAECQQAIDLSETRGFHEATITTAGGFVMDKGIRDNARLFLDDVPRAADWWRRAGGLLPPAVNNWVAHGFNERFRFYRYDRGQQFAPHYDGAFRRSHDERSYLTFLVYLNDDFDGGETKFYDAGGPPLVVTPRRGTALVFVHEQLHEGAEVLGGRKYVLRTDVMYRRPDA